MKTNTPGRRYTLLPSSGCLKLHCTHQSSKRNRDERKRRTNYLWLPCRGSHLIYVGKCTALKWNFRICDIGISVLATQKFNLAEDLTRWLFSLAASRQSLRTCAHVVGCFPWNGHPQLTLKSTAQLYCKSGAFGDTVIRICLQLVENYCNLSSRDHKHTTPKVWCVRLLRGFLGFWCFLLLLMFFLQSQHWNKSLVFTLQILFHIFYTLLFGTSYLFVYSCGQTRCLTIRMM